MLFLTHGNNISAIKIVPISSTFTMTGSITKIVMLHNDWITYIVSFMASKSATQSASELQKVMLLFAFDLQDTDTPNT